MDDDAFPALFAETYLLPPDTRPIARERKRPAKASVPRHRVERLLPRFTLELRAALRSLSHLT